MANCVQNFFEVHQRLLRRWDFCLISDFLFDQLLDYVLTFYVESFLEHPVHNDPENHITLALFDILTMVTFLVFYQREYEMKIFNFLHESTRKI